MMDTMADPMKVPAHERITTISRQIWADKYRLKTADGTPIDLTIEDTWRRVAHALAAVEQQPDLWEDRPPARRIGWLAVITVSAYLLAIMKITGWLQMRWYGAAFSNV